MADLVYQESRKEIAVKTQPNQTILEVSLSNEIPHYSECGGNGKCTTCRIWVLAGQENLSPKTEAELKICKLKNWSDEIRLACQTKVLGNAKIKRLIVDPTDAELVFLETPSLRTGDESHLVVMFCDIEDFTGFAATHLPYDVVHLLNRYYQEIGEPIIGNCGYIDKYMGDGIMVLFGLDNPNSTENCLNAIRASLRMLLRVKELNKYLLRHFDHEFKIRIGLHYGPVIIGEVGHSSKRQITALGDTVNIASRIEGISKEFGTEFLVSKEVVDCLDGRLKINRMFRTPLRGQDKLFYLYEVVGFAEPDMVFIVQSTFEKVVPDADSFAALFYDKLFEIQPEFRGLFERTDMVNQRKMLMNMIGVTVRGLSRLNDFIPSLRELGARHETYRVKPEYYPVAGQALISALESYFGNDFTPEVRQAWIDVYGVLSETMKQ